MRILEKFDRVITTPYCIVEYIVWITRSWGQNHNKTRQNKTVCIFTDTAHHNNDVTRYFKRPITSWLLRLLYIYSSLSCLFNSLVRLTTTEISKLRISGPLLWELTGRSLVDSPHKGSVRRKALPWRHQVIHSLQSDGTIPNAENSSRSGFNLRHVTPLAY